ncbi:protein ARV1 isoform X2 [Cryptotermes secundus]|uniref:protein ARV1 isoform X2 n=1 Tax=Cryptotermes secundus TaxID=105785 RepID=UPI000CD7C60C|nr:protein ARV1 isoform X2 [Cryptotermes secundus]
MVSHSDKLILTAKTADNVFCNPLVGKCHKIADKYIEYDPVIVMIDLVLLNEQAYRHVLYNSPSQSHQGNARIVTLQLAKPSSFSVSVCVPFMIIFQLVWHCITYIDEAVLLNNNHWRLAVILVLFEAYSEWMTHKDVKSSGKSHTSPYDLFEGEQSFYFECLQTVVGSSMLLLLTYTLTWLRWWVHAECRPQNYRNIILWNALVLSNCGKFLMIPSLIWGEIGTETHSLFIMGYTFLSQLKVYSVVCNTSKVGAGFIIFFGLVAKYYLCYMISNMKLQ